MMGTYYGDTSGEDDDDEEQAGPRKPEPTTEVSEGEYLKREAKKIAQRKQQKKARRAMARLDVRFAS